MLIRVKFFQEIMESNATLSFILCIIYDLKLVLDILR